MFGGFLDTAQHPGLGFSVGSRWTNIRSITGMELFWVIYGSRAFRGNNYFEVNSDGFGLAMLVTIRCEISVTFHTIKIALNTKDFNLFAEIQ